MTTQTIPCVGALMEYIVAAAEQHNARPETPIVVRVGKTGPEFQLLGLTAWEDQRGYRLILEASPLILAG